MLSTAIRSLLFISLLVSVQSVRTVNAPDEGAEEVVDENIQNSCTDSDCQYRFGKGCAPVDPDSGFSCTYQYKFGDMTPSQSCRCGGAASSAKKYSSIDEAVEALKSEGTVITQEEFQKLMANYNVPAYTADFEFRKADVNKDGSLSKDEFIKAAEQLMSSTEGGDAAVGSAGSRCCCAKKLEVMEESICVNPSTYQVFSRRVLLDEKNATMDPRYTRSVTINKSGRQCHSQCRSSTEHHIVIPWGQAQKYQSTQSEGQYLEIGNALYLRGEQSYNKCVDSLLFAP